MKTEDLVNYWNNSSYRIIKPEEAQVSKCNFKSSTKEFLLNVGLPDCFGELNFHYEEEPLETVNEKWNLDQDFFNQYVEIGGNGSGDPIAVKTSEEDAIVYLNHENDFQEVFINSDVYKFSACMIRMDQFYKHLKKVTPASTFSTEFTDDEYQQLTADLKKIDGRIFDSNDSYWRMMLSHLLGERDQERKKNPRQ